MLNRKSKRTKEELRKYSKVVMGMIVGIMALVVVNSAVSIHTEINQPLEELDNIEVAQVIKGVGMLNLAEVNECNSKIVDNSEDSKMTLDSLSSIDRSNLSDFEKREVINPVIKDNGQEPVEEPVEEIEEAVSEEIEDDYSEIESSDSYSSDGIVTYSGDGSYGKFKSYMDKDAITAYGSLEYKQKEAAYIDENGVACLDGRMLIAVGTGHNAPVGSNLDVYLSSGKVLKCKVGDTKANRDTRADNIVHASDGSIIEFLVETSQMNRKARQMGDMSYAGMEGGIVKVVKVD